jgi:hypothetical protein
MQTISKEWNQQQYYHVSLLIERKAPQDSSFIDKHPTTKRRIGSVLTTQSLHTGSWRVTPSERICVFRKRWYTYTLLPWRWNPKAPPKRWCQSTRLTTSRHGCGCRFLLDLRFSQRWLWRVLSSGMWWSVVRYEFADDLKESTAPFPG